MNQLSVSPFAILVPKGSSEVGKLRVVSLVSLFIRYSSVEENSILFFGVVIIKVHLGYSTKIYLGLIFSCVAFRLRRSELATDPAQFECRGVDRKLYLRLNWLYLQKGLPSSTVDMDFRSLDGR